MVVFLVLFLSCKQEKECLFYAAAEEDEDEEPVDEEIMVIMHRLLEQHQ
jgi:hypothetical protein